MERDNEIKSFKGRELDESRPVEMYRCLNRKGHVYSLRQGGKVVGHTKKVVLKKCQMIINEAGRKRAVKNGARNVHAFIKGFVGTQEDIGLSFSFQLYYNPFKELGFYYIYGEIKKAEVVYIQNNQVLFQQ